MAKSKAYHNGEHAAHPIVADFDVIQNGITKREHFAGLAMAAWINHHGTQGGYGYNETEMAESAVHSADALLKELGRG